MALLTENSYPMPEYDDFDSFEEYDQAQKEAMDSIDDPVIRFPRADGYALYRVVEMEGDAGEPVLQHIPFGDAYRIPGAHIRGLRTQDVEQKIEQRKKMNELFN